MHPAGRQLFAAQEPLVETDVTFVRMFVAVEDLALAEQARVALRLQFGEQS